MMKSLILNFYLQANNFQMTPWLLLKIDAPHKASFSMVNVIKNNLILKTEINTEKLFMEVMNVKWRNDLMMMTMIF
jgi:hypothetical protein